VQKYNKKEDKLTDYYFWTLENFDRKLTYICERPQLDIGCIEGEGADYRYVQAYICERSQLQKRLRRGREGADYRYWLTFVSGRNSILDASRARAPITVKQ
jgi:hypothetical protein